MGRPGGEFAKHFRLIRYDRRGHGKSGAPKGPYIPERFGRDMLDVLDALKIKKTNWCGLSMGGMVGQWLGANAPDRVEKLILSNTNFYYADKAPWDDRIKFVRENGLAHWSSQTWSAGSPRASAQRAPQAIARMKEMFLATNLDGYIACVEAVRDMDFRDIQSAHHRADAGDRRQAGSGDAAGRRRSDRQDRSRAPSWSRSTPRTSPISSSRRLYTERVLNFLQA